MSSFSEPKFQNEKKMQQSLNSSSKKHRDFKVNSKEKTTSTENPHDTLKYKNNKIKDSPSEFFDFKDFPVLGSKNFEIKNEQSAECLNSKNKFKKQSPFLSDDKNLRADAVNLMEKKNHLVETTSENNMSNTKTKKKGTSKITFGQPARNPNKKKRADPIFINFQDILVTNKIQRKTKFHNIVRSSAQRFRDKEILSGNQLDSCNPKRSKGKHREAKKKKLTNFKMIIIKERVLKQKTKEMKEKQVLDPEFKNECYNLIDTIDFKSEIKLYVNELNKKKLKSIDSSCSKLSKDRSVGKENKQEQEIEKTKLVENVEENLIKINSNIKKKVSSSTSEEVKFSSKFREYCDNIVSADLNSAVTALIKELIKLQDRQFIRDPVKAKARKRHVSGIREVRKYLILKKVKMVIIAPNLEKLEMKGSVYDSINQLKSMAESQNVPYGFALDRYKLGKCTLKNVPVSAFAVLSYEGIETLYENALSKLLEAKKKFSELIETKNDEKVSDINSKIISSLTVAFHEELQLTDDVESELI